MNRALSILAFSVAMAGSVHAAGDNYPAIKEAVAKLAPNAEVTAVADSPIPGMLEVTVGPAQVIYMSKDGQYMVQGTLYDINSRTDLTAQRKSQLRKEMLANVTEAEMITFEAADESEEVYVFTDIDCGYCRKLHGEIEDYIDAGITVHYLAFPRAGVPSESYDKAVSVWCAENPQEAMTDAKSGQTLPDADCDNPVATQYELGRQVGVTGTPAIITADGTMLPGYVPAQKLQARLQQLKPSESAN